MPRRGAWCSLGISGDIRRGTLLRCRYNEETVIVGPHSIRLLVSPSACSARRSQAHCRACRVTMLQQNTSHAQLHSNGAAIARLADGDRRLLCTADYDLTGQILWPAARLLAEYLAAHRQLVEGRHGACELGAGLGLAGITASRVGCRIYVLHQRRHLSARLDACQMLTQYMRCRCQMCIRTNHHQLLCHRTYSDDAWSGAQHCPVVLTDHNEEVLSVLERNAALNRNSTIHGKASVESPHCGKSLGRPRGA